ncbi:MAG: hypothetical protein E6G35_17175 [Actinobacteria bacterium]|nr:MAG: hypothetical protein E6G35_17175 [Actinomycetota bacterium]
MRRWPPTPCGPGGWTGCSSPAGYRPTRSPRSPLPYRWRSTPTVTVGVANYLAVRTSMAEPVAYRLIRALFEHRDVLAAAHPMGSRLDRGEAINTYPLPLHPGATRYYRQMKS